MISLKNLESYLKFHEQSLHKSNIQKSILKFGLKAWFIFYRQCIINWYAMSQHKHYYMSLILEILITTKKSFLFIDAAEQWRGFTFLTSIFYYPSCELWLQLERVKHYCPTENRSSTKYDHESLATLLCPHKQNLLSQRSIS